MLMKQLNNKNFEILVEDSKRESSSLKTPYTFGNPLFGKMKINPTAV